jgi:hypothetical protein
MADRLLLLVEGQDDLHVVCHLLEHHDFKPVFRVREEQGYETLLKGLPIRLKPGSDLERLGVVVDADVEALKRWRSIRGVLERSGYTDLPAEPDPAGTVVDHEYLPRVGVWIMPDNVGPGILEDYLGFLVPAGDSLIERVRQAVDGIPVAERLFIEAHYSKALIHTWLAWQEDPGTPLGLAIKKRYFNAEARHASIFLAWLTRVFS